MTINIISNQVNKTKIRGPKKVLDNTIKGLELLGVDYVLNQPISKYEYNWVQDNLVVFVQACFLSKACIFGPNLAEFPSDLPYLRRKANNNSIFLFPSKWPMNVWDRLHFKEGALRDWSSGVDTEKFYKKANKEDQKILIYFKNRDRELLNYIVNVLNEAKLNFTLFEYGKYDQTQFFEAIQSSKFGIWLAGSETQGYAMLESLSCNLPLIVLGIKSMKEVYNSNGKLMFNENILKNFKSISVTSAPYFNEKCGVIIHDIKEFKDSLYLMCVNYRSYEPRKYILDYFTLDKSANNLIEMFNLIKNEKKICKINYYYLSIFICYWHHFFKIKSWKFLKAKLFKSF